MEEAKVNTIAWLRLANYISDAPVIQRTCQIANAEQSARSHMAHNKSPAYISDVTLPVSRDLSRSRLRSADTTDFIVPRTRTKFGERAFCVSGPTIWYSLPESLPSITCTATFKRHLKTLF